ncbi:GntR family transcriptional regulator [Mycobacterium antarcticum]|uniref:GntR family transcriptional regulator n=1 Tax=unclassified Mycolicibacterium TaxID=2636767 RepID=UPI0024E13E14|nr:MULTISPECIES: GntR family transcriptional regulator [unclassified Mycolicibacterium]
MSPEATRGREQRQLLSEEVRRQLADELSNGTYAPNEKLPSEPEFAKRYGISRPTLREILSGLERDGLIRRVHGVGTFVTPKRTRVHSTLDLDIGVTEAVTAARANLNVEVVEAKIGPVRAWISNALELPENAEAFRIERIIRVDGVPATHGFDVIPLSILERAGSPAYDGGSVYQFLESRCGVHLVGGVAEISPVAATARMAKMLDCSRNSPLLRLEQTERSADGQPVLLSQEHYAPDVFSLTVHRLRRDRTNLTGRRAPTDEG